MTKLEFQERLKRCDTKAPNVYFENTVHDGYYILKNHLRYEVFFRERGKDYNCVGFSTESDALEYLLKVLKA